MLSVTSHWVRGFDVAFEVSGAPGVMPGLFESLRREATLVTIGHPAQPATIDIARFINKQGVTLRGVFGRRVWDTWELLLSLVGSGRLDLEWIITHRLDLKKGRRALELLREDSAKVVLLPTG
jgi:threonine 3-dehydrogenase